MRLGISAFAGDGGKSGISQYMTNIFRRLPKLAPDDHFVLFMADADREFFAVDHPRVKIVSYPNWVGHPAISIFWHIFWFPLALKWSACDCVFMPAANRRLAWWYGMPSVGTVHDMSQLHVPAKYDALRMFYVMHVLPKLMRRLDRVVSISESTRRDLEDYAKVQPKRIHTIYNGVDEMRFFPMDRDVAKGKVTAELPIPHDFILYISRLEHPGKNHVRLIEAFAQLKARLDFPHKLVLVGGRWKGAEAIDDAVMRTGIQKDVIFPGFVPNEMLPTLYAAADLFVFPSLFEGFGLPVIEAMASGVPVCASNSSSLPEIVGDAGLLFDPESVDEIAESIRRILMDRDLWKTLNARGLVQAGKFSWDVATLSTLTLCRELVLESA
jgi:glycosyltransferase involved in cell wall biosynthesis